MEDTLAPRYLLKQHRHNGRKAITLDGLLYAYADRHVTPASVKAYHPNCETDSCVPSRTDSWEVSPRSPLYPLLFSTPNPDGNP